MTTQAGVKMCKGNVSITTLMQTKNKTKLLPSVERGKLNDILLQTYHCVIDKKKKRQTGK
jgi:hypothetical protein